MQFIAQFAASGTPVEAVEADGPQQSAGGLVLNNP
jgi:hypothetical protein